MAKVIGGFKCPYTKRIYRVGEEYTGKHVEEFARKGYLAGGAGDNTPAPLNDPTVEPPTTPPAQAPKNQADLPEFEAMTKKEIIDYAKMHEIELDERMTKQEMIDRVVAILAEEADAEGS